MSYSFTIKAGTAYKPNRIFDADWSTPNNPDRKLTLYPDDVLTKGSDGKWTKQTGLCMCNIVIHDESKLNLTTEDVRLVVC